MNCVNRQSSEVGLAVASMTSRDFPDDLIDESSKRNEIERPKTLFGGLRLFSFDRQETKLKNWPEKEAVDGHSHAPRDLRKLANFSRNSKMAAPESPKQGRDSVLFFYKLVY